MSWLAFQRTSRRAHQTGLTLLEFMVAIGALAILLLIGVPSLQSLLDRHRLRAAAQALTEDLQWMRSEAILRNRMLYLTLDTVTWCYGIAERSRCDCTLTDPTASAACNLKRVPAADYPGIRLSATIADTYFEPRRATARNGTVQLATAGGIRLQVVVSRLGRIRICSPDPAGTFALPGYRPC